MTITVFGDSIAWGMVDPLGGGWVNRLKKQIEKKLPQTDFYNLSIPGNTIADVLERFEGESRSRQPDVIIFAIGINDTIFHPQSKEYVATEVDFQTNLLKLYKLASLFTAKIFFIGLTRVDEQRTKPMVLDHSISYQNERIEKFDALLQNFCQEKRLPYFAVANVVGKRQLFDGLHPTTAGHQALFHELRKTLLPQVLAYLSVTK